MHMHPHETIEQHTAVWVLSAIVSVGSRRVCCVVCVEICCVVFCVVCCVVCVVVGCAGRASAVLFNSLFVVAKVQHYVCVQSNQKLSSLPWARPPLP